MSHSSSTKKKKKQPDHQHYSYYYLPQIEASFQPLDFCFHPLKPTLLAAGLVDGSIEIHDVSKQQQQQHPETNDDGDNDDTSEVDSLLSSLSLHTQQVPNHNSNHKSSTTSNTKDASCKSIAFSTDGGTKLYSAGSAGDFVAVDAERACTFSMDSSWQRQILWNVAAAGTTTTGTSSSNNNNNNNAAVAAPITVIRPLAHNPNLIATGDDAGGVRLWDQRMIGNNKSGGGAGNSNTSSKSNKKQYKSKQQQQQQLPNGCVLAWHEQEDYISALELSSSSKDNDNNEHNTLIATSADCRLGVYDLRMNRPNTMPPTPSFRLSDDQEDELLSLQIMKHGQKVVCGTQQGTLQVFSYGTWGDCSDRFPGAHPAGVSIDAMLKIDEDTLLTGSSDGRIRVVQLHPDKLLGVIGDDHDGFPIEKLDFNSNRSLVGSLTHSNFIKLWDATILKDDDGDDEDDDDSDDEEEGGDDNDSDQDQKVAAKASTGKATTAQHDSDDDWDDMDDDDDDDDGNAGKKQQGKGGSDSSSDGDDSDSDSDSDDDNDDEPETVNDKRKKRLKTDNEKFFEDL